METPVRDEKPCAANPYVRLNDGKVSPKAASWRRTLLCNSKIHKSLSISVLFAALSSFAAEWTIPSGDVVALTNALTEYAADDIITLAAGTYDLAGVKMSADFHLITHGTRSGLTLRGHAADDTILLGGGQSDGLGILGIQKTCTVSNLTFTGGWQDGGSGGAVGYVIGKTSLFTDCVISNNYATLHGGGAYFQKFYNCLFENNSANSSGGAICYSVASNCVFRGNTAKRYGAAVYQNQGLPLIDCKFYANQSESASTLRASSGAINCEFICNTNSAGGVLHGDYATNCIFRGNYGMEGCAVYSATASGCTFEANYTTGHGLAKKASLYDCNFIANTNTHLSTALLQENVTVSNSVFAANHSACAIVNGGTVIDSVFTNNTIAQAITSASSVTHCHVAGNTATDRIILNCTAVTDCDFIDNAASGIVQGSTSLTNCLFRGNCATNSDRGSILNLSPTAYNCRFEANSTYNRGIFNDASLDRCVISCNTNNNGVTALIFSCPSVKNCLVISNVNTVLSRAVTAQNSTLLNCTFIGNSTPTTHPVIGSGTAVNCLLAYNQPYDMAFGSIVFNSESAAMTNCIWMTQNYDYDYTGGVDCLAGVSNMGFADEANGDYTLLRSSPAFEAGTDEIRQSVGPLDLIGNKRLKFNHLDIGCYECLINPIGTLIEIR